MGSLIPSNYLEYKMQISEWSIYAYGKKWFILKMQPRSIVRARVSSFSFVKKELKSGMYAR